MKRISEHPHLVVVGGQQAPPATLTDEALMRLCASGEKRALEQLATRHLHLVASFCSRATSDPAVGQELAQDVFISLWNQRHRYLDQGRFAPYLYTLAINRCRNHTRWWRGWKRRLQRVEDVAPEAPTAEPLELLLAQEQRRWLQRSMAKLPARLREAVLLRFEQGLDYRSIAAVLDCSEVAARARVFRAVELLRLSMRKVDP